MSPHLTLNIELTKDQRSKPKAKIVKHTKEKYESFVILDMATIS